MSEYLFPNETLDHQCKKPADVSEFTPATAKPALTGDPGPQLAESYIHEISNQITVILGISELALEASRGNPILRKHVEQIAHAARRAAQATHVMLELKAKDLASAGGRTARPDEETAILP